MSSSTDKSQRLQKREDRLRWAVDNRLTVFQKVSSSRSHDTQTFQNDESLIEFRAAFDIVLHSGKNRIDLGYQIRSEGGLPGQILRYMITPGPEIGVHVLACPTYNQLSPGRALYLDVIAVRDTQIDKGDLFAVLYLIRHVTLPSPSIYVYNPHV